MEQTFNSREDMMKCQDGRQYGWSCKACKDLKSEKSMGKTKSTRDSMNKNFVHMKSTNES